MFETIKLSAREYKLVLSGGARGGPGSRASNKGSRRLCDVLLFIQSLLKEPTSAYTFKTLLRHFTKQLLTHGKTSLLNLRLTL